MLAVIVQLWQSTFFQPFPGSISVISKFIQILLL